MPSTPSQIFSTSSIFARSAAMKDSSASRSAGFLMSLRRSSG